MHREAPSRVPAAVGWINDREPGDAPGTVLPDGCMDVMWFDGRLLVCGPDTEARTVTPTAGPKLGIRFAPGHLPRVLDLPASALVDERVALADLVVADADRRVVDEAEQALATAATMAHLERLALDLGAGRRPTGFEDDVAAHAATGTPVAEMADRLGLGVRQLHRRCREAFGYGPKVLTRVLRLQRAVALGREGQPPADVAAVAGYADQSHLAREVRELAGATWTELAGPGGPAAQPSGA